MSAFEKFLYCMGLVDTYCVRVGAEKGEKASRLKPGQQVRRFEKGCRPDDDPRWEVLAGGALLSFVGSVGFDLKDSNIVARNYAIAKGLCHDYLRL